MYALYKCIQLLKKDDYDKISDVATVDLIDIDSLFSMGIQGAVLEYNRDTDNYTLSVVDYSDKTEFKCTGSNEKRFHGIIKEISLNTKMENFNLSGGHVGGVSLQKMNRMIRTLRNRKFDDVYDKKYKED